MEKLVDLCYTINNRMNVRKKFDCFSQTFYFRDVNFIVKLLRRLWIHGRESCKQNE